MDKKQQIIVYLLVGTMFLSVIGTGLLLAIGGNSNGQKSQDDDLAQQLEQLQAQQQQSTCVLTGEEKFEDAGKAPEVYKPAGDVTKLEVKDLTVGSGDAVAADSCVTVHYHGSLAESGEVFDSSYERKEPVKFPLTNVIQGWQEGLVGMKVGGVRRIVIPSDLAYGEAGSPPSIPANADLVFVVKLLAVE